MSKLCLGTAQFGLNYGITNKYRKIQNKEIKLILEKAIKENINYFDTANLYGDSEKIIGNNLKGKDFKISTKFTSKVKKTFTEEDINFLETEFQRSLSNLNKDFIETYLIHNPNDLKKNNNHLLINWLKSLKDRGLIKKIGISIYEKCDLKDIDIKDIQIVQMPLSVYDQRLLENNFIYNLLEKDISIHLRSIFLQGLLLQESNNWPSSINQLFLEHHKNYENEIFKENLTLLDSAILFIKSLDFAELIIFGVTNISELNSILLSWNSKKILKNLDYEKYKWNYPKDIDPREWPKRSDL